MPRGTTRAALSPDERRPSLTYRTPPAPRPHLPTLRVDLDAVRARYRAVLDPTTDLRTALAGSVGDVPTLLSEVERLYLLLVDSRFRHANLAAAARATLAAKRDGERDPLSYLRDELTAGTDNRAGDADGGWA